MCKNYGYFVDFSETTPQIRQLANVTNAYFPVISSDGRWITYQGNIEAEGPSKKNASAKSGTFSSYRVYPLSGRYLGTVGSLSQKTVKPLNAGGICLIRPDNTTGGHFTGGVRKVLIVK